MTVRFVKSRCGLMCCIRIFCASEGRHEQEASGNIVILMRARSIPAMSSSERAVVARHWESVWRSRQTNHIFIERGGSIPAKTSISEDDMLAKD